MRTLFFKIFGWFWLSQALIIGATALLLLFVARDPPAFGRLRNINGQALELCALSAAALYETESKSAPKTAPRLPNYLARLENQLQGRIWLFDAQNRLVAGGATGGEAPPQVVEAALLAQQNGAAQLFADSDEATTSPAPTAPITALQTENGVQNEVPNRDLRGQTPLRNRLRRARAAARNSAREAARNDNRNDNRSDAPLVIRARRARSPLGQNYVFAVEVRAPLLPGASGAGERIGRFLLRYWAIFLLISGAVCFALARYLTAPVLHLRAATTQLASGDLSARVGPHLGARRDELADLGHDFDAMAARIEAARAGEQRLLADISHELRSPLARLQVAFDLADLEVCDLEKLQNPTSTAVSTTAVSTAALRELLERGERESGRINALIGQLSTFTRLESTADAVARTPIDLEAMLQEIAADADFEARARGCAVHLEIEGAVRVQGDSQWLPSALENVIRNAVRHTKTGTTVLISLRSEAQSAVIQVRDHGLGVPDAELTQLFLPFYRVESARDRESGGVGLGLAIAEKAIAAQGGSIAARNAEGGGLEIEIRLPLLPFGE